jgi:hypothetical protein
MRRRRIIIGLLLMPVAFAVAWAVCGLQVCRDWAFVCENTVSHKGYRQWPLGIKTGQWYKKSPLETFLKTKAPDTIVHRWTSYAGTGKNMYGRATLFGHASPGAVLQLTPEVLGSYVERHPPEDVRDLYTLLVSDDEQEIARKVDDIWDEFLNW